MQHNTTTLAIMSTATYTQWETTICHSPNDDVVTIDNVPDLPLPGNPNVKLFVPSNGLPAPQGGHIPSLFICSVGGVIELFDLTDSPLLVTPIVVPSEAPSMSPSMSPSMPPTPGASATPSAAPSSMPTPAATSTPTAAPSSSAPPTVTNGMANIAAMAASVGLLLLSALN
mmetsp:Transcript_16894/g.46702  ORF Transcript_16894/g.46702 Transcript_16894/m.46702 type:complete len:171 (-) Transcript_16894:1899-2411(-)